MFAIVSALGRSGEVPLPHVAMKLPARREIESPIERPLLKRMENGVIRVSSAVPCLLERSVYQDGNWSALLKWESGDRSIVAPVMQSSLLNQAVHLPAGDWQVQFQYRPWWKWPSIFLCFVSVSVVLYLLFFPDQVNRGPTDVSPEHV